MQLIHLKYEHGIGLTWCWFFNLGKTHNKSIFPGKLPLDVWGRRLPCDVSLTPKKLCFSQLIICCWLELDMPSLDETKSEIGLS